MNKLININDSINELIMQLTGCYMVGFGIWLRYEWDFRNYIRELHMFQFWTGNYILIVVGSFVMVLSFIGCCGAIMENPSLLGLVR